jgi:hypothetical protein
MSDLIAPANFSFAAILMGGREGRSVRGINGNQEYRLATASEEIGYERQKPNIARAWRLHYLVFQMRFSSINLLSFLRAASAEPIHLAARRESMLYLPEFGPDEEIYD